MSEKRAFETLLIQGGSRGDEFTGAVNVPVYLSSTFRLPEFGRNKAGFEYVRTANPSRKDAETLIAQLEEGVKGFAFSSGMAAVTTVLSLFSKGDRILLPKTVYGGTYRLLNQVFNRFGLRMTIVEYADESALREALTDDVRGLFIETPANPVLAVTDIEKTARIAHEKNVLVIADNTFMTPYLQRPLTLGADIVLHSATKYLAGHSDVIAGVAVVKDAALAEKIGFLQNALGAVLPPFDSYLLVRGIKTLAVRMDRHLANASVVAAFLVNHRAVDRVWYPGLESDPGYALQKKQAKGAGGMISFRLKAGYDYKRFFKALRIVSLAESLGGVESLVCHLATMTHGAYPKDLRDAIGVTDDLIRLSVGIEAAEDITADLDQALTAARVA